MLAACGLAFAACAAKRIPLGPQPDYQAPAATMAPPANLAAVCYDDRALAAYRVRMVQQELAVGVLSCQAADGKRQYDAQYQAFIAKFNPELATNASELQAVVAARSGNFDVVITEIANRTAQRPREDPAFCSRHLRALEWALTPKVTSLTQVPAPYDLGPEMNVFPCRGT